MNTTGTDPAGLSLADKRAAVGQLLRRRNVRTAPLSSAQRRLWFLDRLEPHSSAYNIFMGLRLLGPLDTAALERAFRALVKRHGSLRTTFATIDGNPVQVIAPDQSVELPLLDLRQLSRDQSLAELQRVALEESRRPFNLARGRLLRTSLVRLANDEHALLLTMHHIASDGWSLGVIQKELAHAYHAFSIGQPLDLPPLPIEYADYAQWQAQWLQEGEMARQLAYWKRQLEGAPRAIDLPSDRVRPAMSTMAGAHWPVH